MASSPDALEQIAPCQLELPLTPSVAAEMEGIEIDLNELAYTYQQLAGKCDLMLVEGAGGLLAPLYKSSTSADFVSQLGIPLIVVARNRLGTINHTLLTVAHARQCNLPLAGIIINACDAEPDPSSETNPEVIRRLSGVPLLGVIPHLSAAEREDVSLLAGVMAKHVDHDRLEAFMTAGG